MFLATCGHHGYHLKMADTAFLPIWRQRFLKNHIFNEHQIFSIGYSNLYTQNNMGISQFSDWFTPSPLFKSMPTFLVNFGNKNINTIILA